MKQKEINKQILYEAADDDDDNKGSFKYKVV
jgi:hypothetical protein